MYAVPHCIQGVYIDGHEREDVVKERNMFVIKLHELESSHLPPLHVSDVLPEQLQPVQVGCPSAAKCLAVIFHDESIF